MNLLLFGAGAIVFRSLRKFKFKIYSLFREYSVFGFFVYALFNGKV
jgi:hypothetical protein